MSSGAESTDFLALYKKSSKELYSEKFYDAMDMESTDLQNYDHKCNDIIVNQNEKGEMIKICKKYLRFLDKSKTWSGLFLAFDISLILNYWLYDKVTHIYGTTKSDVIGIGFGALQGKWDTFDKSRRENSYYKQCKPEPSKVNHEDWKNRKKLYDYYVDFETLHGNGSTYDEVCKEYYRKIKEMIPVCKYFQGKCSPSGTYSCPDNYSKCTEKNLETALKGLPCYHTLKDTEVPNLDDDSAHQPPRHEERAQDTADGSEAATDKQLGGNSGIGTKVSHSVLGAAPVLLTATMLYRYTPLGPWIRRFGGGRTNNINAMDTFSHYTPETGDMFSEESANYISYQPM
ncbi:VIR protein [Plasmodium vivax]|uniref:VIR protein n=1 Tax=Plasmodium vivax TaxID=5855 RepID=A0A1G4EDN8_PLAVI|nr:VIR protein [Plasmodium vivax]